MISLCLRDSTEKFIRTEMRKWRNWQTRRLQVPVVAIPCGFKSRLPHFFILQDDFFCGSVVLEKESWVMI